MKKMVVSVDSYHQSTIIYTNFANFNELHKTKVRGIRCQLAKFVLCNPFSGISGAFPTRAEPY